ncbi:MAG: GNAT family N-acetyltransferase [Planctomycetota bacterium]|nr:GNAT family N-acetyltransferase [Planctomycetota bacterium]
MTGRPFRDILTPRLRLRPWRDADLEPFAAMNADERVMACMPGLLDRAASDAAATRLRAHFDEHGFGKCVVETRDGGDFAGVVGLAWCTFDAPMNPSVEVGWRLAHSHWGKGYAAEAARAALDFGFRELKFDRIYAFTVPANERSWRVMKRLGMTRSPADDFDHPLLPPDSPLRRHVTYVMQRDDWERLTRTRPSSD